MKSGRLISIPDPPTTSAGDEFLSLFVASLLDAERRAAEAVAGLKSLGYAAAHPDDGWVDRERGRVHLAHPYFLAPPITLGSRIALGDVDRGFRAARVARIEDTLFGLRWYHFSEIGPA